MSLKGWNCPGRIGRQTNSGQVRATKQPLGWQDGCQLLSCPSVPSFLLVVDDPEPTLGAPISMTKSGLWEVLPFASYLAHERLCQSGVRFNVRDGAVVVGHEAQQRVEVGDLPLRRGTAGWHRRQGPCCRGARKLGAVAQRAQFAEAGRQCFEIGITRDRRRP